MAYPGSISDRILAALLAADGAMSVYDIAEATGLPRRAVQPRLAELVQLGRVRDSGQTKKSPKRRTITCWEVSPHWRDAQRPEGAT